MTRRSASVYLPEAFAERDLATLHDLIDACSFALLIAPGEDSAPVVAHLPFLLDRARGPHGTLRAHIARANPVRHALDGRTPVMVVFTGPHGYVSPSFYASRNDVPTWNYAVVHAHGTPRALETEAELLALLTDLSAVHERGLPTPWSPAELTAGRRDGLLPAIVGFEIEIARLDGKFKLSQNRRAEDREGAIRGLAARGTPDDQAMVKLMTREKG